MGTVLLLFTNRCGEHQLDLTAQPDSRRELLGASRHVGTFKTPTSIVTIVAKGSAVG